MPTGYRVIIAGLGALIVIMAFGYGYMLAAMNYPQEPHYPRFERGKGEPAQITWTAPAAERTRFSEPCKQPQGREESDLCAQWRAAKAAENGAYWTEWGVYASIAGILGLLFSIAQGRIALERAREANQLTREVFEAEVRPWLVVKGIEGFRIGVGHRQGGEGGIALMFSGRVVIKNIGQAPALDVFIMMPNLQGLKIIDDWDEVRAAVGRLYELPERYTFALAPTETGDRHIMASGALDEVLKPWEIPGHHTVYPPGTFRIAVCYRAKEGGKLYVTEQEWVIAQRFTEEGTGQFGAQNWDEDDFRTFPFPHAARVGRTIRIT